MNDLPLLGEGAGRERRSNQMVWIVALKEGQVPSREEQVRCSDDDDDDVCVPRWEGEAVSLGAGATYHGREGEARGRCSRCRVHGPA